MRNERALTSYHVRWKHIARQGLLRRLEDIRVVDDPRWRDEHVKRGMPLASLEVRLLMIVLLGW